MKAYSVDLRERVLRAVDQGRPRAEIVQLLGVSLATIKRYLKQRRDEGHVKPHAIPGRTPKKRAALQAGLEAQLRAHDDATLEQHCELWEHTHGEVVRSFPMSRAIEQLGWTRKKSRWVPASATKRSEPPGEHKPASMPPRSWSLSMNVAPTLL